MGEVKARGDGVERNVERDSLTTRPYLALLVTMIRVATAQGLSTSNYLINHPSILFHVIAHSARRLVIMIWGVGGFNNLSWFLNGCR